MTAVMKLRITKGRIAAAVALAPVLYVLNIGPLIFCCVNFGFPTPVHDAIYRPLWNLIDGTPLQIPVDDYVTWWAHLSDR
jgi:hypothetical protein